MRCRYAETYKAMGLGEIGHLLSCNRDGAFCEGYDPKLKLERTQTIMQGASHCDFRYTYEQAYQSVIPEAMPVIGSRSSDAVGEHSSSTPTAAPSSRIRPDDGGIDGPVLRCVPT